MQTGIAGVAKCVVCLVPTPATWNWPQLKYMHQSHWQSFAHYGVDLRLGRGTFFAFAVIEQQGWHWPSNNFGISHSTHTGNLWAATTDWTLSVESGHIWCTWIIIWLLRLIVSWKRPDKEVHRQICRSQIRVFAELKLAANQLWQAENISHFWAAELKLAANQLWHAVISINSPLH